jgi:hypothetical protein
MKYIRAHYIWLQLIGKKWRFLSMVNIYSTCTCTYILCLIWVIFVFKICEKSMNCLLLDERHEEIIHMCTAKKIYSQKWNCAVSFLVIFFSNFCTVSIYGCGWVAFLFLSTHTRPCKTICANGFLWHIFILLTHCCLRLGGISLPECSYKPHKKPFKLGVFYCTQKR